MKLPPFTCKAGCSACCSAGPVPFSNGERERIDVTFPDLEWLPWGDEWLLLEAVKTFRCPLLVDGRCSAHEIRPMACRLYGVVDAPQMRCKRGGKPSRLISEAEARRLMRRRED